MKKVKVKKVVMFSASWCGPCRQAKPVFSSLKDSIKDVEFQDLDIDENINMAKNLGVYSVPTFIIFEDDKEVNRLVGGAEVNKLKELL